MYSRAQLWLQREGRQGRDRGRAARVEL